MKPFGCTTTVRIAGLNILKLFSSSLMIWKNKLECLSPSSFFTSLSAIDTQYYGWIATLSIVELILSASFSIVVLSINVLSIVVLSIVVLSIVVLSIVMLSIVKLSIVMLNIVMLIFVILSVIMLSVVVPSLTIEASAIAYTSRVGWIAAFH